MSDTKGWARGQTSPGLKSTDTGHYTAKVGKSKSGNSFARADTRKSNGYAPGATKSGQTGSRPGAKGDQGRLVSSGSWGLDVRGSKPKVQ